MITTVDAEVLDTPSAQPGAAGRIPALDGLRALAVLAVMFFHTGSAPMAGGYLGVDVFFVLSGFLIAGILMDQHGRTGRIELTTFWLRRARRLAPPLLVLLLVMAIARLAVPHPDSGTWREDIIAALTYTTNWFQIAVGKDYFAQFVNQSPLLHTWSLAIEEQFYLVFAVLMVMLLRASRRRLLVVFVAIALMSAAAMAALAGGDPVWAYYSTATRVQALLVGAVLAVLVRRATSWSAPPVTRPRSVAGWAGAAILAVAFVAEVPNNVMLRGGFLLAAVSAGALIWGALGSSRLGMVLSWRPLVALGVVSYGIYLWHWPVFLLLHTDAYDASLSAQMCAMLLSIALATLSYVAVERPVRTGGFTHLGPRRQWVAYAGAAMVIALLALLPARTSPTNQELEWPAAALVPSRILVAGDSTTLRLWEQFPHSRYPQRTVGGPARLWCGVVEVPYVYGGEIRAAGDCANWEPLWRQKVAEIDPQIAVVGSIVWDVFDRWVEGRAYPPGTAEFDRPFVAAFRGAISAAGSDGTIPVYVLGQPCMTTGEAGEQLNDAGRTGAVDALIRSAVQSMPNAHFVDIRPLTCGPGGSAVTSRHGRLLRDDGVHWVQAGSDEVWSMILNQAARDGTWADGASP